MSDLLQAPVAFLTRRTIMMYSGDEEYGDDITSAVEEPEQLPLPFEEEEEVEAEVEEEEEEEEWEDDEEDEEDSEEESE